jgi:multidrug resistance efflux pump
LERAIQCGRRWLRGHRAIALAGTTAILAGAAAIPLPLHVDCACSIEPVVRRHVAAPFQGPLEESLVEPGDMVQAGQVLASMDGREIRWELAGVRAALHRAEKERAGHMATHDSGKAELARLEMEKLRLRMELLEHREQQLQIRSPIDGIVVKGDLKKSEGVPLDAGQKLFEIAPLDAMVVELLVESRDVGEVEAGMPVNFYLDASPFTRRAGIVERVQPRSEMRDNVNVFVAELRIDNDGGELRPGMRGNARITSGRSTLAWNLLRKPLGALVSWLGW